VGRQPQQRLHAHQRTMARKRYAMSTNGSNIISLLWSAR
jgi:hypothetical protein